MSWITVYNRSPQRQRRWIDVVLDPVTDAGMPRSVCSLQNGMLLVRGEPVGDHGVTWHAFGDFDSGLYAHSLAVKKLADKMWAPFVLSNWIGDDLNRTVLRVVVDSNATGRFVIEPRLVSLLGNEVKKVAHFRGMANGWHFEAWVDVYSGQDVMPYRAQLTWSDRESPEVVLTGVSVDLFCGERFTLDYRGDDAKPPFGASKGGAAASTVRLLQRAKIVDALGIPIRGQILCYPNVDSSHGELDDVRYEQLDAAAGGPVRASCQGFYFHQQWLTFGRCEIGVNAPQPLSEPQDDLLAPRPLANSPSTGDTGSQPPFGASKGGAAVWSARELYHLLWSADDYVARGLHNRERDGERVLWQNHPRWETFTGVTERNSNDTLGKVRARPWGWSKLPNGRDANVDDQHRGDAYILAAYALTGDPMLRSCLLDMLEVDRARAKRARGGLDAPRASGRLWQSWAKMVKLLPEKRDLLKDLAAHELTMVEHRLDSQDGDVRWLTVFTGDDRVLNPQLAPLSTAPWNEALAVLGAYEQYHAWRDLDPALAARFKAFALRHGETIVRYGYVVGNDGRLWCITGLRVNPDNSANDASYYTFPRDGADTKPTGDLMVAGGGWHFWFAGAVAAVSLWSQDAFLKQRVHELRNGPLLASSTTDKEWIALPFFEAAPSDEDGR